MAKFSEKKVVVIVDGDDDYRVDYAIIGNSITEKEIWKMTKDYDSFRNCFKKASGNDWEGGMKDYLKAFCDKYPDDWEIVELPGVVFW